MVGQANVATKKMYIHASITKADKQNIQPQDGFTAFSF
jgi:hypothetical protein